MEAHRRVERAAEGAEDAAIGEIVEHSAEVAGEARADAGQIECSRQGAGDGVKATCVVEHCQIQVGAVSQCDRAVRIDEGVSPDLQGAAVRGDADSQ